MRLNLAIIPAPHEGAFGDEVTDSGHAEPYGVCLTRHAGEAPAAHKSCAISTTLADGRVLESDLVMPSIGVAPESTLAREAGLELGLHGSIKVDAAMRTSDPDIYATHDEIARHRGGAQEPQSMLHRPRDRTIAHALGSLLLLPMSPLARTLFDCIDCRARRLDRVDDATRRVGGPLDRRGLHE